MNKFLLFIFFLFSFNLHAQLLSPSILYWQDKKLEWDDFKGLPNNQSVYNSELRYFIGYSIEEKEYESINIRAFVTYSYLDRNSSWAKPDIKSENYLMYNQTIFNICELYSRYLQKELNSLVGSISYITNRANKLLIEYSSINRERISDLQIATNYGHNIEKVNTWDKQIHYELNQNKRNNIPDYELTNNGIGGSFDLGYGMLFSNLNSYFTNGPSFSFGLEYLHRPFVYYLRGTLNANKISNTFTKDNKLWEKGLSSGLTLIHLTMGYPVIENRNYKLTPFGGLTLVEFSINNKDEQYNDHQLLSYSGIFGLIFDYNFHKSINFIGTNFMRYKTDWFVRTSLYFVPISYDQDLSGSSINLTIGLGGLASFIKNMP